MFVFVETVRHVANVAQDVMTENVIAIAAAHVIVALCVNVKINNFIRSFHV